MTKHTHLPRGIRTRGAKFFVDVTVGGTRKTATCDTLDAAICRKHEITEALTHGKEVHTPRANAKSWTLQEALDKTLSLSKPEGWRGCSYEKQATLNAMDAINYMGPQRRLDTITRDLIDAWLHDCEARGNSDSTINRKRSALSKMAKVAYDYGGLADPMKLPRQRKEPVGRIRQISKTEETELISWCMQWGRVDVAEAVTVLIYTGMRRGELLQVRPTDVDLDNGVIMVYGTEGKGTKNGKIRSVPMTKAVRGIMQGRMDGRLCFDVSESELRHTWDSARAKMGLTDDKDFTLHVCRHTCASRLVQKGVSLPVVQAWLGHSNISTTMRYAHLYPSDLMKAVSALEDLTWG